MKPRIAIFTTNFPFKGNGGELPFLAPEILLLVEKFEVVVIPWNTNGPNLDPEGKYSLDTSLAQKLRDTPIWKKVLWGMGSNRFYHEILSCLLLRKRPHLQDIFIFACHYEVVKKWLDQISDMHQFQIYYTYWCTATTAALTAQRPSSAVITRLHRFDIYEELRPGCYIPGLRYTLSRVGKAICISRDGVRYLEKKGVDKRKLALFMLGVPGQPTLSKPSQDGTLRLISVSRVVPLKRVDAICQAVGLFAQMHPQTKIEWSHIGDGPAFDQIKEQVAKNKYSNLVPHLLGHLPNEDVMAFYRSNPIDLFIHASESEGLPVSIQEALSFGIPVIATNVGGVSEIVSDDVGYLIESDHLVANLLEAMERSLTDEHIQEKRKAAAARQKRLFDAQKNHKKFVEFITNEVLDAN